VQEASEDGRRLRLDSEDYVDAKLAQLEGALQRILEDVIETNQSISRTIDQVQAGREKLRGSVPTTNVEIGPDVQMPMLEDEGA
jgi:uncharacterized protein YPO0396